MNVLIIPEDFRKDQHVLKPILTKMMAAIGKPNANIQVCLDPLLGGVTEALKWERISEVIKMYPMVAVFLLIVDRDAKEGRRAALDNLSTKAASVIGDGRVFLAENAWQEIEVWALAGIATLPKGWVWNDVRFGPIPRNDTSHRMQPVGDCTMNRGKGERRSGVKPHRTMPASDRAARKTSRVSNSNSKTCCRLPDTPSGVR